MSNLRKTPIVYVTRDIERALGLSLTTPGYFIISNNSPFAKSVAENRKNVLLIKEKEILDTWELLQHQKTKKFISSITSPQIVVFKPTPQIEKACADNGWELLNPSAELSNKVEEKISQIEWLGPLKKYLPDYKVLKCKEILEFLKSQGNCFFEARTLLSEAMFRPAARKNNCPRFILQFNRSHTGSGTILIENLQKLKEIIQKFPEREARIAKYIQGPLFTNNNVVVKDKILIGNINYQITGLLPFTDNPFTTIGNDWELPHKILNNKQIAQYNKIATDIGNRLRAHGWKGLFGIDVVMDEKTGKLYLLEINCRQPASTTYESVLQNRKHKQHKTTCTLANLHTCKLVTTFQAHLLSLLDIDLRKSNLIPITSGAQIIQRVTKDIPNLKKPEFYKLDNRFSYILYNNTKPGSDLLRLQTKQGIMEKHNQLNALGNQLMDFVFCANGSGRWNAPRGAVIIIKDKKILLVKRHKCGQNYYVLPGGTMDKGETIKETAIREAKEETGLDVILSKQKPWKSKFEYRDEYYFFVEKIKGKSHLGGPEAKLNNPANQYWLEWVDLNDLKNINLVPQDIKIYLISNIQ